MRKMNCAIQWIEIYLMDSVIHLLNNWDQVRDGPLENLWGGAGEVPKKYSRKGKLNEKKFMHAN